MRFAGLSRRASTSLAPPLRSINLLIELKKRRAWQLRSPSSELLSLVSRVC